MEKTYAVEEYIEKQSKYSEALLLLRDIIISTNVEETIKWGAPVYTLNGKNVLGLGAFKNHFGIWFFNGIFLKDTHQVLVNAQENKTKALRQMRFESVADIDKNMVLAYVKEAIENQKLGKELKPNRKKKKTAIPEELNLVLKTDNEIKAAFENLTPYKQREYCEYISSAKRHTTKQTRINKITPIILKGIGLNDKYKNC